MGQSSRFLYFQDGGTFIAQPVQSIADQLRRAGINGILIPAWIEGKSWYSSSLLPSEATPSQTINIGKQLQSMGFQLGCLVQVFSHGGDAQSPLHPARTHPDWLSSDLHGWSMEKLLEAESIQSRAIDGFFFDPGIPRVQEYLHAILTEIAVRLQPNWMILDQVCYPIVEPVPFMVSRWEQPLGYHPVARHAFEAEWGVDPVSFLGSPRSALDSLGETQWNTLVDAWDNWRCETLNQFIRQAKANLTASHPDMKLAVVGYPDPMVAKSVGMQDWLGWLGKSLVDAIILPDNRWDLQNRDITNSLNSQLTSKIWVSGPLSIELDRPLVLKEKIQAYRNLDGILLFDSSCMDNNQILETLQDTWWSATSDVSMETSTPDLGNVQIKPARPIRTPAPSSPQLLPIQSE